MYNVVIVEDDPMVLMINEQYVQKNKDFTVIATFKNGKEFLEYIDEHKSIKIDLVILDVFMPYLNGIETLKIIREKKYNLEVIMVTAANDTQTLEETIHLGVVDYLIKPFAFERFQVALQKFSLKVEVLKGNKTVDQNNIDSIISNSSCMSQKEFPKGIQEKTLETIKNFLQENPSWHRGDIIGEKVNLSSVTIRHYMNYLIEQNQVVESINYETGGRPSILYKSVNA